MHHRFRTTPLAVPVLLLSLVGCGPLLRGSPDDRTHDPAAGEAQGSPPHELVAAARDKVTSALGAAESARMVLETLGLLPEYTCGEARGTFVGRVADGFARRIGCAEATARREGSDLDLVTLAFDPGCRVGERTFEGEASFSYSGGEDRLELALDLSGLKVDGHALNAGGGYVVCGDETRYWAEVTGPLGDDPAARYEVDLQVASREGPPVIGGSSLLVDGAAILGGAAGQDGVTLQQVSYEVGEWLPKEGTFLVDLADGHRVRVVFTPVLFRLGRAEITVDDYDPVTVPVPR